MVFSRQGCPWCDKLLPVLQKAILNRTSGSRGEGMLFAPLRVFIYDAEEFGPVISQFGVEGFPTMLVFGGPGVKPRMVPGYLDDADFERLLTDAATAEPEPPEGQEKKGWGPFR